MLSAECFRPSQTEAPADIPCQTSRPSESIAANGDGPSQVTIEGEGTTFLQRVRDCADQEDSVIRDLKELHRGKGLHHENGERRMAWYSIEEGYMFPPTANSDMIL